MMGCLKIGDPRVTVGFNSLKLFNDLDDVKGVPPWPLDFGNLHETSSVL